MYNSKQGLAELFFHSKTPGATPKPKEQLQNPGSNSKILGALQNPESNSKILGATPKSWEHSKLWEHSKTLRAAKLPFLDHYIFFLCTIVNH